MKLLKEILLMVIIILGSATVLFFFFVDKGIKLLKQYIDKDI
jgi:hypothetical protein